MPDWWLGELDTAGPEHLDPSYVAGYDAKAQFDPSADLDALRQLGLGPSSTVIDIGAGTGVFAAAAAELGAAVTAVDVSPAMTAALRTRAAQSGLANITVVDGGFLSYQHRGPRADFVFSRNALHQLPDFWKVIALRRIHQMLRPDGVFRLRDLVYDVEPDQVEATIDQWMAGAAPDGSRGYTAADFADHVRTEYGAFTWLLEPMLERTGFEIVDREVARSLYAAYTCRPVER